MSAVAQASQAQANQKIYETLKYVVIGCCVDISSDKHYNKLKNMLENNRHTLTAPEIDELCKTYRNTIYEIHGFYPIQDCNVIQLLKSTNNPAATTFAKGV
jgi:hypothetical protein